MNKNDAINITNNSYPDEKSGLLYNFFRYIEKWVKNLLSKKQRSNTKQSQKYYENDKL